MKSISYDKSGKELSNVNGKTSGKACGLITARSE